MADDLPTPDASERHALLDVLGVDMSRLDVRTRAAIEALCDEVLVLRDDAGKLREALDEAASLADNDALCPVFNRRAFEREIRREIALAARFRTPLSLIFIDLDNFKQVNDVHGHLAGDHVLSELAKVLAPTIRSEDTFARYGGEEFVVMSRSTDPPSARVVSERLRSVIEAHEFVFEGTRIPITISVGLASMPNPAIQKAEDLVALADKALYQAKNAGRNRVVVAGD